MKHWFKDQHFRSLLKNSSYLAASRIVALIAAIATISFAAHALGLLLFGALDPDHELRQGGQRHREVPVVAAYRPLRRPRRSRRGRGFQDLDGLRVRARRAEWDRRHARCASQSCPSSRNGSGISPDQLWLAMLYCTLLPTMGAATPSGVLRALDRFDLISWQSTATPISRVILVAIAYFMSAPFGAYVAAWYVTDLGGDLYLWFLAWRELRRRGLLEGIRPTLRPETLPGAWRFAIHVNLTASVQAAWGPIARLVVGGLLGPAGAALFRVASSLSDGAAKPADLLGQGLLPRGRANGPHHARSRGS